MGRYFGIKYGKTTRDPNNPNTLDDDYAYRLIKPNQSDVELTPVEHYFNITGQVSTFIILIFAGFAVAKLKMGRFGR